MQLTEERISNKIVNVGEQMDLIIFRFIQMLWYSVECFYLCVDLSVFESIWLNPVMLHQKSLTCVSIRVQLCQCPLSWKHYVFDL